MIHSLKNFHPNSSNLNKLIFRFDNVKYKSEPVSRKIRVGNRSSIPISITWMTFLSQPSEAPEDREDPFNICIDMFTNRESAEESSESTKVYIMKNTAEKAPSFMTSPNLTGMRKNRKEKYLKVENDDLGCF